MVRGVKTGVSIALVGILAGGGGAYAATQITSSQIKDGTIQAKDIKTRDDHHQQPLGRGQEDHDRAPAGAAGATGPGRPRRPRG